MPLVGDLIVRARNIANDPCQTLSQPTAPAAAASGVGIFNGSLFGFITYLTSWGETIASTEIGPIATANQGLALSAMVPPLAAVSARFYYGYASGAEQQFVTFTPGVTATIGLTGALPLSGVAPYKPSAYLPDTDGDLVSAFEIYRWINAGLVKMGRLAGGILDQTGVAMPAGNAEVAIPGWWLSIKYTWHNGWLTLPEQQSYTWLQSPVTGIPGITTLWRNGAQQIMGTWPQPSIAPAFTTLTVNMGAADNVATVGNTGDFHGTDGTISLSTPLTLTSLIGGFTSGFVGLTIAIQGAGPAAGVLTTTVANVVNQNTLTLTAPAITAVNGVVFDITGSGAPSFTAPGMMQIDSEIMSYSQTSATQITGIIRGYSGTIAAPHSSGAVVSQLIFRLLGRRMPVQVIVGQSANTLDLPQGWDEVMDNYLLSRFKQTEQNVQEAQELMTEFEKKAIELRDDQIPLESKQVGGLWPLGGAAQTLADIMDTVIVQ